MRISDWSSDVCSSDLNLNATNNVLAALVEAKSNAHLVHLGTMGVYGYGTAGMKIPEGYLTVKVDTGENLVEQEILYPVNPGSIYHLTKTQDQLFFAYRSEEHTSELQSLIRISYAVFCLKKQTT